MIMLVTWLAGKHNNEVYALQNQVDQINKTLESFRQKEKVYMEEAAERFEEAKILYLEKNKRGALLSMKIKALKEEAAQFNRDRQLILHEHLVLTENAKKELIEAFRDEDQATKKPTDVFIYCFLFLLILTFFVSL